MLSIQPGGLDGGDEELRSVGILTSVGHGQETRTSVAKLEVLVGETVAVDRLATGSVVLGEITTLNHEVLYTKQLVHPPSRENMTILQNHLYLDDTVESAVLVTIAFLAGSQSAEVLDSLGDSLETKKGMSRRETEAVTNITKQHSPFQKDQ